MQKKNTEESGLTPQEQQLIERLRQHPELLERFQAILEIASPKEGPIKKADEVEALLLTEIRRLGHTALGNWGDEVEKRLGRELQGKDASAYAGKKKR